MSYSIKTIPKFDRDLKRLIGTYPSLKVEFIELVSHLKKKPNMGTAIGHNCYKIRLAIASKGKGKSGDARLITHFYVADNTVYLLSIYDKADQENISDSQIKALLKLIG